MELAILLTVLAHVSMVGKGQTAVKGVARILQHMDRIVHSFVRVTGTIQSCAILGQELVFASQAMLDIIVIVLVLCILMVGIVEMFVIAKTTPFVTQPTENALVHQDSWVKNAAKNVPMVSMEKGVSINANARMVQNAIHLRVNATVPQVGQEYIVILHVPSELTDKIVRKNVLVKMGRLVIMSQESVNVWPDTKDVIVRCLVIEDFMVLAVRIGVIVCTPMLMGVIQSLENAFANLDGKV